MRALSGAAGGHARRLSPELSAGSPIWLWQKFWISGVAGLTIGAAVVVPGEMAGLVSAGLGVPFAAVIWLRLIALRELTRAPPSISAVDIPVAEFELPVYSLLVPLFREAAIVPDLVEALSALDYPADKLEILIVVETDDSDTRAALDSVRLDVTMRVIVAPRGKPQTKPRALNFALVQARGCYVVIYDAEDLPEPDQLRRALGVFRRPGRRLGCVQARLDIHNPHESWLARQFTIEYAVLFGAILPALARLGWPVPLGGTSNHFPGIMQQAHQA